MVFGVELCSLYCGKLEGHDVGVLGRVKYVEPTNAVHGGITKAAGLLFDMAGVAIVMLHSFGAMLSRYYKLLLRTKARIVKRAELYVNLEYECSEHCFHEPVFRRGICFIL